MSPLAVGEAFRFGSSHLLRNLPVFVAIEAGTVAVWLVIEALVFNFASTPGSFEWVVLHLLWFVGMSIPEGALLRVALRLREAGDWNREDLAMAVRLAPNFFVCKMTYLLMVSAGLLLAIVPGVYLAVRFAPWSFVMVGGEHRPLAALRTSSALTCGARWRLLGFGLLLLLVNATGAALLGLGLILTLPLTTMAAAFVFTRLRDYQATKL